MVFEKHFILLCDPSETVSEYLFFTLAIQRNHINFWFNFDRIMNDMKF